MSRTKIVEINPKGFRKVYDRQLSHLTQAEIVERLDGNEPPKNPMAAFLFSKKCLTITFYVCSIHITFKNAPCPMRDSAVRM